eukprot:TRINITY_DN1385_c0_g3_i1.p1 TRINITY_DN1385_c0_g3~~TRINITY_DN1385_c0_g3_i1.p1  ORF type:complete len:264 (-),score=89.76 TRINITY_DN1385_c0_g3_i1:186-977(-)
MRQLVVAIAAAAAMASAALLLVGGSSGSAFLAASPEQSGAHGALMPRGGVAQLKSTGMAGFGATQRGAHFSGAFGIFAVVAAAVVTARVAARTQLRAHVRKSWQVKQRSNWLWNKLHPPKTLKQKDLKLQETKAKLILRDDLWATEYCVFVDPRDEQFQYSEEKARAILENPDYESPELERQKLGLPPPPFTLLDNALKRMRGGGGGMGGGGDEANMPKRVEKKPTSQKELDTRNLELEFINFKGYDITKAQRARLEARSKKK